MRQRREQRNVHRPEAGLFFRRGDQPKSEPRSVLFNQAPALCKLSVSSVSSCSLLNRSGLGLYKSSGLSAKRPLVGRCRTAILFNEV